MSLEQDLKRLRDERQQKFNEEDWEGALQIHDRILELSPSPLRYANRGSILYRLGRIEEAIAAYREALDLDPSLRRAKADLERLEGQLEEQQQQQEQQPEQKETNLPLPDQNANIPESQQEKLNQLRDDRQACLQNEDWEGALAKHDQILEIEPTALRYANKGSILYRLGHFSKASESYRKALELDPTMEPAKRDLERLEAQMEEEGLLRGGKQDEKEIYEKIELLRKQRQEKVEQGLWEEALSIHDQVLALEPTALRHANRGALLYRLGKHREAIASYQTALGLDSSLEQAKEAVTHLEGLLEEESLLAGSEQEDGSQEELARQITQYRDERQVFIKEKNWEQALAMHDRIIELEPTALRYVNRGAMLYRMKRLQEAIDAHKKALEMDPSLDNAKKDIVRMEKELQKKRAAQEELITPLVDEPTEKEIEEKLESLKSQRQEQIELNNWEKALEYQNEIIDLEPNALRYTNKGSMLYRLGKVNEAILCYRKALELDPELERATSDLERLKENEMDRLREERQEQMEEENWGQALYLHDIILALETTALRMANRGSILYRMNRFQEAMSSYRKALELDPDLEKAKEDIERLQEEINQPQELSAIPEEFEEDDEEFFDAVPVDEAEEMESANELSAVEEIVNSLPTDVFEGHKGEVTDIQIVANTSTLISTSKDKTIRVWDIESKECLRILEGHDDWIRFLTLSPDGTRLFSCSDDWNVRAWNFDSGQCEYILEGHTMPVLHVSTSPSHRFLFSTSRDRTIKIWDYQNGKLLSTLEGHEDWVNHFIPTPDGNKAISSSLDGDIRIWNVLGWRCTNTLKGHEGWIEFLYLIQDGRKIISGSSDNTIKVWNFAEGTEEKSISTNTALTDMILTKDETKVIAATKDNTIRVWDLNSGECLKIIRGQNSITAKLALIHNDEYILSSSLKGEVNVWCISTGTKIAKFNENNVVNKFIVLDDKNLVIGACRDNTIKMWNTEKCRS
ncbi:tetratricopeptide repeat protein [Candidatus Uabimicrobium sp. HlEnr_7]|uniref:tetratricopeptide repeat protein n=1 Tax=Candidatus Uabimicrobium helgolandensis TaxID=3095367 RepID=UPI003558003B